MLNLEYEMKEKIMKTHKHTYAQTFIVLRFLHTNKIALQIIYMSLNEAKCCL